MYEGRAQGIVNGAVLSLCCPSPEQKEVGWCLMWALKNNNNSQQELEGTQSPTVAASSPFPLLGFCSHGGKGLPESLFCVSEQLGDACAALSPQRVCPSFGNGVGSVVGGASRPLVLLRFAVRRRNSNGMWAGNCHGEDSPAAFGKG